LEVDDVSEADVVLEEDAEAVSAFESGFVDEEEEGVGDVECEEEGSLDSGCGDRV